MGKTMVLKVLTRESLMRKIVLGVSAILLSLLTVADPARAQVALSNTPVPSDSAGPSCYTDIYGYALSVSVCPACTNPAGCACTPSIVTGGGQVKTAEFFFPSGLSGKVTSSVHPRFVGGAGYNYQILVGVGGVGSVSSLSVPFAAPLVSVNVNVNTASPSSAFMEGCNEINLIFGAGSCNNPNPANDLDDRGFAFTPSPLSAVYSSVGTVTPTISSITALSGGTYKTGFTGLSAGLTSRIFGVATSLPGGGTTCSATLTDSAGNTTTVPVVCPGSGPTITTVAGNGQVCPLSTSLCGDGGTATAAQLNFPYGLAVDGTGNLFIADKNNHRVRKVSGGLITTVAGTGVAGFSGDGGPATAAQLNSPTGVAVDGAGNLFIADYNNQRIRKVSGGLITTVAGTGKIGPAVNGGPATGADLFFPTGVAVDGATPANVFIADSLNQEIRRVDAVTGNITAVAGTGVAGSAGDGGPATAALLNSPIGVALDGAGNVFIADQGNNRIRKVSGGLITTVAGTGLNSPSGVALDGAGNLFIADLGNNRIAKVSGGTISTFAGTGVAGFSGDGGPATGAQLNAPYGVAVDGAGHLFIADLLNQRIRRVSSGP